MTTDLTTSPTLDLLGVDRQTQRRILRQRALPAIAYGCLVALGARKGGVLGWFGAGVGLWALARTLWRYRQERPEWRRAASRQPQSLRRLLRGPRDPVDQASAGSFPASDAPGYQTN